MKILKCIVQSLILAVLLIFTPGGAYAEHPSRIDKMKREYIHPVRIVWQSDITGLKIENADRLLHPGNGQADLHNDGLCRMISDSSHQAAILLDFGRELHGGIEIVAGRWQGNKPLRVRVRMGESVSEAMSELGGEKMPPTTMPYAMRNC
jgi:alpha-L-rhamnosidase